MNIKYLFALLLSLYCISASAQPSTQSEAKAAIHGASNLWAQAKSAGHEWSTIKPLIAQAKKALEAKEYATAVHLAEQASAHSQQALIQAEHEKTNWVNSLPK